MTKTASEIKLVGTKIGKCDICKETKKILLLKYGFTLCEECLTVCTTILDQLQTQTETTHEVTT